MLLADPFRATVPVPVEPPLTASCAVVVLLVFERPAAPATHEMLPTGAFEGPWREAHPLVSVKSVTAVGRTYL